MNEIDILEVRELKPVRMLVSDDMEEWYPRDILGKVKEAEYSYVSTGGYFYKYAKPMPEPEEMTVEEICKELGREIKIKKG